MVGRRGHSPQQPCTSTLGGHAATANRPERGLDLRRQPQPQGSPVQWFISQVSTSPSIWLFRRWAEG